MGILDINIYNECGVMSLISSHHLLIIEIAKIMPF